MNRYEIVRPDGRRSCYLARDRASGETLQLWRIREPDLSLEAEKRALRDVLQRRLALRHPALPNIRDVLFSDGRLALVVRPWKHRVLSRSLVRSRQGRCLLPQLVGLWEYLHRRGLVVGTILPEQLGCDESGNLRVNFLLTDSWLPCREKRHQLYAAPEVLEGEAPGTGSDTYLLGLLLYELLTGRPVVSDSDPRQLRRHQMLVDPSPPRALDSSISPVLSDVLMRLLDKRPERRPRPGRWLQRLLGPSGRGWPAPPAGEGLIVPRPCLDAVEGVLDQPRIPDRSAFCYLQGAEGSGRSTALRAVELAARIRGLPVLRLPTPAEDSASGFQRRLQRFLRDGRQVPDGRPRVLCIDDLDRVGSGCAAILRRLLVEPPVPLVLVAAGDPWQGRLRHSLETAAGFRLVRRVEVLSRGEARRLLESVAGAGLDRQALRELLAAARGSPGQLLDCFRVWAAGGPLHRQAGRWRWRPVVGPVLPAGAARIWSRELALLPEAVRQVLHSLADWGGLAPSAVLGRHLGLGPDRMRAAVLALRTGGWIRTRVQQKEVLLRLRHRWLLPLLREGGPALPSRRALRSTVDLAIGTLIRGGEYRECERLLAAQLREAAQEAEPRCSLLCRLARLALYRGQYARAVQISSRALRLLASGSRRLRSSLQSLLARGLAALGETAARHWERHWISSLLRGSAVHERERARAAFASRRGRPCEAVRRMSRSLRLRPQGEEGLHHLAELADLQLEAGDLAAAGRLLRYLDVRTPGSGEERARLRLLQAVWTGRNGHPRRANRLLFAAAGQTLEPRLLERVYLEAARNFNRLLQPGRCRNMLESIRELGGPHFATLEPARRLEQARCDFLLGRAGSAVQACRQLRAGKSPVSRAAAAFLVRLLLHCRRVKAARRELPRPGGASSLGDLLAARAALQAGSPSRAEGVARRCLEENRERTDPMEMLDALDLLARCRLRAGDTAGARRWAEAGLRLAAGLERPDWRVRLERLLARIEIRMGRRERAGSRLRRVRRFLRRRQLQLPARDQPGFLAMHLPELAKREHRRDDRSVVRLLGRLRPLAEKIRLAPSQRELNRLLRREMRVVLPGVGVRWRFGGNGNGTEQPKPSSIRLKGFGETAGEAELVVTSRTGSGLPRAQLDFLDALTALVEPARAAPRSRPAPRDGLQLPGGAMIVGRHPRMQEVFRSIRRVGPRPVTVLIHGETGTGKELIARALHEASNRTQGPFVAVNCAAVPEGLIENELFGHRRGSFTGAAGARAGLVESASGGTLFLDEVSSMPLGMQSRLLRTLEQKAVRRLGETREREVDVRVVAASNQPLDELVLQGLFREDLFHRLDVVRITLPALRQRRSDIPLLACSFLERLALRFGEAKRLSREAERRLLELPFPGNVRELKNLLERSYHLTEGELILSEHLETQSPSARPGSGDPDARTERLYRRLCSGEANFWTEVRGAFLARDLCREQLRGIIARGLEEAGGNYRRLLSRFHLPPSDYHRFLAFLTHHRCKLDFRRYR